MQVAEYFRVFSYELRSGRALTKKQPDVSLPKSVFLGSLFSKSRRLKREAVRADNEVFGQFEKTEKKVAINRVI